jgi:hypothetical protein
VRNGLAHQYQQIIVSLKDGKLFGISLTGAESGRILAKAQSPPRLSGHLSYTFDKDGDLILKVYTDILFLDIKLAIDRSGILKKGLSFAHMYRPKGKNRNYNFDITSLENSLSSAGHLKT